MAYAVLDGLTATAGGGQALAAPLGEGINRIATCATAADSSRLPPATSGSLGTELIVINAGAASMNVFPSTGDGINALAVNAAFAVAAGKSAMFHCASPGRWYANLSA